MFDAISAFWLQHAPVLSVLLPVFTAVALLLLGDPAGTGGSEANSRQRWGRRLAMASVLLGLFMAINLVRHASGGELPGMVIAYDEDEVTVDFNHPLSGRTILFDVLVHRVEPAELH